jgi:hypothetical protein
MDHNGLLIDLFDRISGHVHEAVDRLDVSTLNRAPEDGSNHIGWLIWHLTRVQDHHISALLTDDQLWVTGDWAPRFGVESDPDNTGYGHTREQVAAIRPQSAQVLIDYYEAVSARTHGLLEWITAHDLERIVDENFDPPVTLGVRLISIADDDIQHAGQAAYARGILDRR